MGMKLSRKQAIREEDVSIDDLFSAHRNVPVPEGSGAMPTDKYDIPPFLRLPPIGLKERLEMTLSAMDRRLAWLAERGMRPNQSTIERRAEMVRELEILSQVPEKVGAGETA